MTNAGHRWVIRVLVVIAAGILTLPLLLVTLMLFLWLFVPPTDYP